MLFRQGMYVNHNSQLVTALEKVALKKRMKVGADPNTEFVRLKDVREVKAGLGGPAPEPFIVTPRNRPEEEEEESEYETDESDCIIVRTR